MEYLIAETTVRYHRFNVDEEVDMEKILDIAPTHREDSGYDAICKALEICDIAYVSEADFCGSEVERLEIADYDYM